MVTNLTDISNLLNEESFDPFPRPPSSSPPSSPPLAVHDQAASPTTLKRTSPPISESHTPTSFFRNEPYQFVVKREQASAPHIAKVPPFQGSSGESDIYMCHAYRMSTVSDVPLVTTLRSSFVPLFLSSFPPYDHNLFWLWLDLSFSLDLNPFFWQDFSINIFSFLHSTFVCVCVLQGNGETRGVIQFLIDGELTRGNKGPEHIRVLECVFSDNEVFRSEPFMVKSSRSKFNHAKRDQDNDQTPHLILTKLTECPSKKVCRQVAEWC